MGRKPCCAKVGVNRGAWITREDRILTSYIKIHGEGKWRDLPQKAGLNRCGKSCRLRWLNYLRPDIKRGNISVEEDDLIIKLHNLLGNRWSLIAGRLPGRTDNEIKNYWNSNLSKRCHGQRKQIPPKQGKKLEERESKWNFSAEMKTKPRVEPHQVIRTKAQKCTKFILPWQQDNNLVKENELFTCDRESRSSSSPLEDDSSNFLMDFNISDLLISDGFNLEFKQEIKGSSSENDNEGGGDFGGINILFDSDFVVPPAVEAMLNSSSSDEAMLDDWKVSDEALEPHLHLFKIQEMNC